MSFSNASVGAAPSSNNLASSNQIIQDSAGMSRATTNESILLAEQASAALLTTIKSVDKAFANVGDTLTYTINVVNSGDVAANNTVLTDALPIGTTYVLGSLTGATGAPPTLTLNAPVPAGGSTVVTYKVLIGAVVPYQNPVQNSVFASFTYTTDPLNPNSSTGTSAISTVTTLVNTAHLAITKNVDKTISYVGNHITYQIAVKNTGNVPANNVVISDPFPTGTVLVPGSMAVSVPFTTIPSAIVLSSPVAPGQTVTISYTLLVVAMPNPNPIVNIASSAYTYTVDPATPDGAGGTTASNAVSTVVFRNNFGQQVSDLVQSVALEQAALAAIANAEGAKIQRISAMPGVTPEQLLCLNKSVTEMIDSIALLEAVLRQKLGVVSCQIDGVTC